MNEPTWANGIIGGGLRFDGINDYIDVGDPPILRANVKHDSSVMGVSRADESKIAYPYFSEWWLWGCRLGIIH